jgi:hypothetical protein
MNCYKRCFLYGPCRGHIARTNGKAWTDKGFVFNAKARIFNNMLYVRYVHLTRPSIFIRDNIRTARVQLKKIMFVILEGLGAKTN